MFGAVELEEADDSLVEVRPYLGMPHSEVLISRACGRAENMYRSLLEKAPGDPTLLLRLSAALLNYSWAIRDAARELQEAEQFIDQAMQRASAAFPQRNLATFYLQQGLVMQREGRWKDAMQSLNAALSAATEQRAGIDPQEFELLTGRLPSSRSEAQLILLQLLAQVAERAWDFKQALEAYRLELAMAGIRFDEISEEVQEALQLWRPLWDRDGEWNHLQELSFLRAAVGSALFARRLFDPALEWFTLAILRRDSSTDVGSAFLYEVQRRAIAAKRQLMALAGSPAWLYEAPIKSTSSARANTAASLPPRQTVSVPKRSARVIMISF
jgi:tetratricopeptide (TPR) repeat protein